MGTTLTGTTPQDTYDSLIKVTDNGPLSGSLKVLTDGLGNNSALSLSTGAASITGTLAVTSSVQVDNELVLNTNNAAFRIYRTTGTNYFDWSSGQDLAISTVTTAGGSGRAEAMRITSAGNVGIGTSTPTAKLDVSAGTNLNLGISQLSLNNFTGDGIGITFSRTTSDDDLSAIGVVDGDKLGIFSRESIIIATGGGSTYNNTSETARFTANGLTFNGDTAAANALDDYEEGTWTMGLTFDGASVGLTYSTQAGTYTKIGRQVTLNGRISLSAKGSSTGEARITGLPFTIANTEGNRSVPALRFANITFANQFQGFGVNNTTQILLQEITEAGTDSVLTNADFANNSEIFICFTYFV